MTAIQAEAGLENPDAYWDFVTVTTDASFEGQQFDRKEAGRPEADGTAHNAKLSGVRNQIEMCFGFCGYQRPRFALKSAV